MRNPAKTIEAPPDVIIGLGNPGPKHDRDRHNAGFWFIEFLARRNDDPEFASHSRAKAEVAEVVIEDHPVLLARPQAWMNQSGLVVRTLLKYMNLPTSAAMIVHDDIDLPLGTARLKTGGGHGGHNGLRDIIRHCGPDFQRLRLGVGRPGDRDEVTPYVLSRPPLEETEEIAAAMVSAMLAIETLYADGMQKAMTELHSGDEDIQPPKKKKARILFFRKFFKR